MRLVDRAASWAGLLEGRVVLQVARSVELLAAMVEAVVLPQEEEEADHLQEAEEVEELPTALVEASIQRPAMVDQDSMLLLASYSPAPASVSDYYPARC